MDSGLFVSFAYTDGEKIKFGNTILPVKNMDIEKEIKLKCFDEDYDGKITLLFFKGT